MSREPAHLTFDQMAKFVNRGTRPPRKRAVRHLKSCSLCRETVQTMLKKQFDETLEEALVFKMSWKETEEYIDRRSVDDEGKALWFAFRKCFLMWFTARAQTKRILNKLNDYTGGRYFSQYTVKWLLELINEFETFDAKQKKSKKNVKGGAT